MRQQAVEVVTEPPSEEPTVVRAPLIVTHGDSSFAGDPRYEGRFEACRELRAFVWEHRPRGVVAGPDHRDARIALVATFFRSIQTYDVALLLCDRGYARHSLIVGRSLFEDMVVAQWTRHHPVDASKLFLDHLDHSLEVYREQLRQLGVPVPSELSDIPAIDEARRRSLDKKFGKHGHELWTDRRIREMVDALAESSPANERYDLLMLYGWGYLIANRILHNTPFALNQPLVVGGSDEHIGQALWMIYFTMSGVAKTILEDPDAKQLAEIASRHRIFLVELRADVMAKTKRNDPCPCGSGRKFKYCHGSA